MPAHDNHVIETFLFTEARLLDRKQFDDWYALFYERCLLLDTIEA